MSTSLYNNLQYLTKSVIAIPYSVIRTSAGIINVLLDEPEDQQQIKVRPPRFVSFTMELEPYSKPKAFALEKLNDINQGVIEAETI